MQLTAQKQDLRGADRLTLSTDGFFRAGGTLPADSPSYVVRAADVLLLRSLRSGELCYVLTARQVGKSSLLVRALAALRREGRAAALVDLTSLGQQLGPEQWYRGMLEAAAEGLGREDGMLAAWEALAGRSPASRFFGALERSVAREGPLTVAFDEIDSVRSLRFSTDEFFAGIRALWNSRGERPALQGLGICLVGAAAPADLIRDPLLTPFNVGTRIELDDFSPDEALPLAWGLARAIGMRSGLPPPTARRRLRQVLAWTGGHPFLTQRLCAAAADERTSIRALAHRLFLLPAGRGLDSNLAGVRDQLLHAVADRASLLEVYERIRSRRRPLPSLGDPLVERLIVAGVVVPRFGSRRGSGEAPHLVVRNRIYARVFDGRWVRRHLPDAEKRRQAAAFLRGALQATGGAALVLGALAGLLTWAMVERDRAEQTGERYRAGLVASDLDAGTRLVTQGDPLGALLPFGRAMVMDADREEVRHRQRIGGILGWSPRLRWATRLEPDEGTMPIATPAIGPDGRRVAMVEAGQRLVLMDAATGKLVGKKADLQEPILQLAFSPDSQRLAVRTGGNGASVFDPDTARRTVVIPHAEAPHQMGPWRSTTDLITVSNFSARVWNLANPTGPRAGRSFPVGRLLTYGADPTRWWFTPISSNDVTWRDTRGGMHTQDVGVGSLTELLALPGGRAVAVGHARLAIVGGATPRYIDHSGSNSCAPPVLDARGARLLAPGADCALLISGFSGDAPRRVELPDRGRMALLAFGPGTGRMLTLGVAGRLRLWMEPTGDTTRCLPVAEYLLPEPVAQAVMDPTGGLLITRSSQGLVRAWELPERLWGAPPEPLPDGEVVMATSADGGLRLIQDSAGVVRTSAGVRLSAPGVDICQAVVSPDGTLVALCDADGRIRIVRPGGEQVSAFHATARVDRLVFSPGARWLAATGRSDPLRIWDTATGRLVATEMGENGAIPVRVAFAPGDAVVGWRTERGAVASGSLSTQGLKRTRILSRDWDGEITLTPDGSLVAAARFGTARMMPVDPRRPLVSLPHSGDPVITVRAAPDGRSIATGGMDGTIRLWNLAGELLLPPLRMDGDVDEMQFSADGHVLAALDGSGRVRTWDTRTGSVILPGIPTGQARGRLLFSPRGDLLLHGEDGRIYPLPSSPAAGALPELLARGAELAGDPSRLPEGIPDRLRTSVDRILRRLRPAFFTEAESKRTTQ